MQKQKINNVDIEKRWSTQVRVVRVQKLEASRKENRRVERKDSSRQREKNETCEKLRSICGGTLKPASKDFL